MSRLVVPEKKVAASNFPIIIYAPQCSGEQGNPFVLVEQPDDLPMYESFRVIAVHGSDEMLSAMKKAYEIGRLGPPA